MLLTTTDLRRKAIAINLTLARIFHNICGFFRLVVSSIWKGHKKHFIELGIDLNYFEYSEVSDDQRDLTLLFIKGYTKSPDYIS